MKIIIGLFIVIQITSSIGSSDHQYPEGLVVETILKPDEDCGKGASRGDMLTMHYRGTLVADGSEFDSR